MGDSEGWMDNLRASERLIGFWVFLVFLHNSRVRRRGEREKGRSRKGEKERREEGERQETVHVWSFFEID